MSRELLVFGQKTFKIIIPDNAKVTFGPWSPGEKGYGDKAMSGTLRVYESKTVASTILCVFSGVTGFRDLTKLGYMEEVAKEEGAVIWEDDMNGYTREEKVSRTKEWMVPNTPALPEIEEEEQNDDYTPEA